MPATLATTLIRPIVVYPLLALVAAACGGSSPPARHPVPVAAHAELAAKVDALAARFNGGMAVMAVRKGETLVAKGYGEANVELAVPVTPETVFRIGSVTKQFTAVAILQLVAQGKISLDDELTRFLPDYPTQGRQVTIHHLLNHTSGIQSYTDMESFWPRSGHEMPREEFILTFANEPFQFEPGAEWHYNNSGYYLLGIVIEKVTGKSYADHLQETLFAPLGLSGTSYCENAPVIKHRAAGYSTKDGQLVNAAYLSMAHPYAAGSLCSTVGDLVKWTEALHGKRLVTDELYARMIAPTVLSGGATKPYGYGLQLGELSGHPFISHGGGINGFVSMLDYYPADELTVVVLANTDTAAPEKLGNGIARLILGIPEPVVTDLKVAADELAKYSGTYEIAALKGMKITFLVKDGSLHFSQEGGPPVRLMSQGEHVFVLEPDHGIRVTFVVASATAGTGATVETVTIEQGGQSFEGKRLPDLP